MLVSEENRLYTAPKPNMKSIQRHIQWLERSLEDINQNIEKTVKKVQRGAKTTVFYKISKALVL
jgi:hypothetical protein